MRLFREGETARIAKWAHPHSRTPNLRCCPGCRATSHSGSLSFGRGAPQNDLRVERRRRRHAHQNRRPATQGPSHTRGKSTDEAGVSVPWSRGAHACPLRAADCMVCTALRFGVCWTTTRRLRRTLTKRYGGPTEPQSRSRLRTLQPPNSPPRHRSPPPNPLRSSSPCTQFPTHHTRSSPPLPSSPLSYTPNRRHKNPPPRKKSRTPACESALRTGALRPQPSDRQTLDYASNGTIEQRGGSTVDELHPIVPCFIRVIRCLVRNAGSWLRFESGNGGRSRTTSGRKHKTTTSDSMFPAPSWTPHVWCQLTDPCRLHHHIRHGHTRCGPLLNHPAPSLLMKSKY